MLQTNKTNLERPSLLLMAPFRPTKSNRSNRCSTQGLTSTIENLLLFYYFLLQDDVICAAYHRVPLCLVSWSLTCSQLGGRFSLLINLLCTKIFPLFVFHSPSISYQRVRRCSCISHTHYEFAFGIVPSQYIWF